MSDRRTGHISLTLHSTTRNRQHPVLQPCLDCMVRGGKVGWGTVRDKPEGRGFDSRSLRPHYGAGVNSASNRNEYLDGGGGVKAASA
jgi:hypothetical protein